MLRWQCIIFSVLLLVFAIQSKTQSKNDIIDNGIIEVFNNCECVRYYQCDDDGYLIESGETLIDPRTGNNKDNAKSKRIKCKGGAFDGDYVCCKSRSNLVPDTNTPVESTSRPKDTKIACGEKKTVIGDRIYATDESEMYPLSGEFPWLASIFIKNDNTKKYEFSFSGSLIHPKVILTAAHKVHRLCAVCWSTSDDDRKHLSILHVQWRPVKNGSYIISSQSIKFIQVLQLPILASELKVVVNGELELPFIGNNTMEERNVEEIIRHEEYNLMKLYNDVALLILDKPYSITERHVNSICLPPDNIDLEGTQCVVAGWGEEIKPSNGGPKVLKKVMVPFVEHSKCQDQLRETRLGRRFRLHKTFVCAGGEKDKDACRGDGGSPLMCPYSPGEPRFFQAGIVAWGVGCGEENVPGVYGNVKEFKEWIRNKLLGKNIYVQ